MRIAVGSDHAGSRPKGLPAARLTTSGHDVEDPGRHPEAPVDHPESGVAVGGAVSGVRGAVVHGVTTAFPARAHDHADAPGMGGRMVGSEVATESVDAFLSTEAAGGRHDRRIREIAVLEAR